MTPTTLLARSAAVFASRVAVVDGDQRFTYAELGSRVARLAGALRGTGVEPGDRVAVLAPNTHVALEATLAVPQGGAILVMLNTRLSPPELAGILSHAEPTVLIVQAGLAELAAQVCALLTAPPRLVTAGPGGDYEPMLAAATPYFHEVRDEGDPLALNYTSGTTGKPKGALYHHRGAYLQALSMAYHTGLGPESVYLWTLPMFHCNGWCFPWAVTAAGATHVCLPKVDAAGIWSLIRREGVTHCCAAPTVLNTIIGHPTAAAPTGTLRIATGGAPPAPALIERATALNIDILHLYGLTETFGPSLICQPQPGSGEAEDARFKARQGVPTLVSGRVRLKDPTGSEVAADGRSIGEIAISGNTVMSGYFRDEIQTAQAMPDGWLVTGDLAVRHPDGYVEIRDRSKDVIISGGENITSVEVEQALSAHPAVSEVAVVAAPHPHWGEVPVAYVQLRAGASATEHELIEHVRGLLAHFKAPKKVIFGDLPHTATGKVQKFKLRESTSPTLFESEDGL